ncbi:hypothetical protein HYFRA_00010120 [Hymenoscyphus fraxineus]|uniref:Cytochrome P450 n=1 Tax=Hymenoscyphus fraxineus TaxID=746836 RepID=A0A9N9PRR2_9HELO|nr:hypothetical protein HYFRA_00010120 [Hymenoscyphus fraxineus]
MALLDLAKLKQSDVIIFSIVVTLICLVYWFYLARQFPSELSVSEKPDDRHFSIKSRLAFYFDCSSLYGDVWRNFSKMGLPVLVPTLGTRRDIFLPHSSIPWAMSQPTSVLGMWEAFNEMFQLSHSLGHEKYMLDTWTVDVSRRALTQDLEQVIDPVWEEIQLAVDEYFGLDTEAWSTLDLLETIRNVINRASGRFVVGLSLCRNKEYLATAIKSIDSVVTNAGVTGFMPACLRPILGHLACWETRSILAELESFIKPMIENHLAHITTNPDDDSNDSFDLQQRMLRYAAKNRSSELRTDELARRLVMTNLGFVYQGSFAAANMVRNIVKSDVKYGTIAVLRDEAKQFIAAEPDPSRLWRRPNVDRMVFADSAARESLRLNTVPTRALVRQVMVDGLKTDTGLPLPKGALISFVSQPMHTDPDLFPDPNTFDPFRFVRLREADDANISGASNPSPHSFLSTSNLLIFGRGRKSCPGRYFVDFQLKMLVSYLFTNYEIKLVETTQPFNKWMLEFIFPSKGIKMVVKRRVKADSD